MKYTIILTVYNKEKYLERALKSICNQTLKDYEIIIVNDGSTDNSEKIIKKYQKKYKIKYYKKENTGISDTRNYAIEKVKTKYFLFVDADDYISIDLLEKVDSYNDYDVLSFNAIKKDKGQVNEVKMEKPVYNGTGEQFFTQLVQNKCEFTVPWGYVYNTDFFKKQSFKYPKGKILEDYYLTPLIILECKNIISIDYYGYYYCITKNSITTDDKNNDLIKNTYLEYFDELVKLIDNKDYSDKTKKIYKSHLAGTLIWYGSKLKGKEQQKYIKEIEKRKIVSLLERPTIRKKIIQLLYKTRLYYPLRKIVKGAK